MMPEVGITRQNQFPEGSLLAETSRFQLASPIGAKVVVEMNHRPEATSKSTRGSLTLSEEFFVQEVVARLTPAEPEVSYIVPIEFTASISIVVADVPVPTVPAATVVSGGTKPPPE